MKIVDFIIYPPSSSAAIGACSYSSRSQVAVGETAMYDRGTGLPGHNARFTRALPC